MASDLARFTVTMPEEMLEQLDAYAARRGTSANRSEAIRDLVRERLTQESLDRPDAQVVGAVTMVYDHHVPGLATKLGEVQHAHIGIVVSTMHVHLDSEDCLEILAVRGPGSEVRELADCLLGIKGVRHGELSCVALEQGHGHSHEH